MGKKLRVHSLVVQLQGLFAEEGQHQGRPCYVGERGGCVIFFAGNFPGGPKWYFAPQLPQGTSLSVFLASTGDALSPEEAAWPEHIQKIEVVDEKADRAKRFAEEAAKDGLPAFFRVESKQAPFAGDYKKKGRHEDWPVYVKADSIGSQTMYIFRDSRTSLGPRWFFADQLPQTVPFNVNARSESDQVSPEFVDWSGGVVDAIHAVSKEQIREEELALKACRDRMPGKIVVSSRAPKFSGEYVRSNAWKEWPAYQKVSGDGGQQWIYRESRFPGGKKWLFVDVLPRGNALSYNSFSSTDGSAPHAVKWPAPIDTIEPIQDSEPPLEDDDDNNDDDDEDDVADEVAQSTAQLGYPSQQPTKPPKSKGAKPGAMYKIISTNPFLNGIYRPSGEHEGKPVYCKSPYLFHDARFGNGGRWYIAESLPTGRSLSVLVASENDAATPDAAMWPAGMIKSLKALDPTKEAERMKAETEAIKNLPEKIAVDSDYSNMSGGFVKSGEHDGWPAYAKDLSAGGQPSFVFRDSSGPEGPRWYAAPSLPPRAPFSFLCKSNDDGDAPHLAHWPMDKVTGVRNADGIKPHGGEFQGLFRDPEFPASQQSVGPLPAINFPVEWIPARALSSQQWPLFDGIDPTDLLQGSLGDCWLVAALACAAESPNFVRSLFVATDEKAGKYTLRLFDHFKGKMRDITVDEFIPCHKTQWWDETAATIFARPNGKEIWCLILEKAMAKMYGSYGALQSGSAAVAFRCFTGCAETYSFTKRGGGRWLQTKLQPGGCQFGYTPGKETMYSSEEFFHRLKEYDEAGYLMAAAMEQTHGFEHQRADGLVEGHAFSILKVVEIEGQKLVSLRNPWGGEKEWKGAWCDKSPLWEMYPGIAQQLRPRRKDDGMFFMPWSDFLNAWDSVQICMECINKAPEQARRVNRQQKLSLS